MKKKSRALVLIAHGSRLEAANEEIRALALRLQTRLSFSFNFFHDEDELSLLLGVEVLPGLGEHPLVDFVELGLGGADLLDEALDLSLVAAARNLTQFEGKLADLGSVLGLLAAVLA